MLTRREIILTQICLIERMQGKGLVDHALNQIRVIMELLGLETVTEQEIVSLVVELESSRTEIALRVSRSRWQRAVSPS